MENVKLLGVQLSDLTREQLREALLATLDKKEQKIIVTPNPEMLLDALNRSWFKEILNEADLSLPDGFGIKLVLRLFYGKSIHRHTGVDTLELLAELCEERGRRLMLLGGHITSAEKAAKKLREKYPDLMVRGFDPGRILMSESGEVVCSDTIIDRIQEFHPDVLAVALGQRKQEAFSNKYLAELPSVKVAIGVGGALEMISGKIKRAPAFLRKIGLEWLWRLALEPGRIGRIIKATIIFPIVAVYSRLRSL